MKYSAFSQMLGTHSGLSQSISREEKPGDSVAYFDPQLLATVAVRARDESDRAKDAQRPRHRRLCDSELFDQVILRLVALKQTPKRLSRYGIAEGLEKPIRQRFRHGIGVLSQYAIFRWSG